MGTLYQEAPSMPQDLKVSIHQSSMVFPSKETERKSLFLSNIDRVLNFDVETVHFFEAHKDFPPHIVADKLKKALSDALVAYDFFAGRLKLNSETGRLEIDCNAAGAGFVVASSDFRLDQIGDLVYPNPAFAQLVHKNKDFLKPGDQPLCVVQVHYIYTNCQFKLVTCLIQALFFVSLHVKWRALFFLFFGMSALCICFLGGHNMKVV